MKVGAEPEAVARWFRHRAIETARLAGLCLCAQVHSNRRFRVDMEPYPMANRIFAALDRLPVFSAAVPEHQPDAGEARAGMREASLAIRSGRCRGRPESDGSDTLHGFKAGGKEARIARFLAKNLGSEVAHATEQGDQRV